MERNTFHSNMYTYLENILNWPKLPSFLMLILILKVKFFMNLSNFVAIEIKLDTLKTIFYQIFSFEKKQIHSYSSYFFSNLILKKFLN